MNDDPRLTAYALGELELEAAREVRNAIASDPAAQQYVQDVRAMAGMLREQLNSEPAGEMNDHQRSAVRTAALHAGAGGGGRRRLVIGISFAMAAMVLLSAAMTLVLVVNQPEPQTSRTVALHETQHATELSTLRSESEHSGPVSGGEVADKQDSLTRMNRERMVSNQPQPTAGSGAVSATPPPQEFTLELKKEREELDVLTEGVRGRERNRQLSESLVAREDLAQVQQQAQQPGARGYEGDRFGAVNGVAGKPVDAVADTRWAAPRDADAQRLAERRTELLRRTGRSDVALSQTAEERGGVTLNPTPDRHLYSLAGTEPARRASGDAVVESEYFADYAGGAQVAAREGSAREVSGPTPPVPMPGLRVPDLVTPPPATAQPAPVVPGVPDETMLGLRLVLKDPHAEEPQSREQYLPIVDNAFELASAEPLSTFSIDVDTASYSNVRRFLKEGTLPPRDAVRIEELINYFSYDYAPPAGDQPFAAHVEVAAAPWNASHQLVRIGLKGREMPEESRPPANLVFLLDVSGSMKAADKLPLLKQGMSMLAAQLRPEDRVAIVTYAGDSRVVLNSTSGDQHEQIQAAIDQLQAGGSTNGGAGIAQAYQIAARHFVPGGVNRVILATDGDFNVGTTSMTALQNMIENKRDTGVFLSVLGFGTGNLKDGTMEMLADKGNGNYAYIDNQREARKVLVDQMQSTLITIAKDVKVQVEFNPALVESYRLIGSENRKLAAQDFNDDRKDAGEIGAGHTVTALYEVVPAKGLGKPAQQPRLAGVDRLRYTRPAGAELDADADDSRGRAFSNAAMSDELLTVKLRYKQPEGDQSHLLEFPVRNNPRGWEKANADFKFAAAVAGFGMLLRESPHKGAASWPMVLELAAAGQARDEGGWRGEFVDLARTAKNIAER